jgi:hypothetical protein
MTRGLLPSLGFLLLLGIGPDAAAAPRIAKGKVTRVAEGLIEFAAETRLTTPLHLTLSRTTDMNGYSIDVLHGHDVELVYDDVTMALIRVIGMFTDDERENVQATAHLGLGVDNFAAGDLDTLLDADASGRVRSRGVGGVTVAYRLFRNCTERRQLWMFGETVHGVRSTEVDCRSSPTLSACQPFTPSPGAGQFVAVIRNASSLEAFVGLRYELLTLRSGSASPSAFYVTARAGFLSVVGHDDAVDAHHVGIGAVATKGRFQDSYLEVGFGRTDLYLVHPRDRYKIDGLITWQIERSDISQRAGLWPFVQLTVDSDFGSGGDSIQSYFGVAFDLDALFGKTRKPPDEEKDSKKKKTKSGA